MRNVVLTTINVFKARLSVVLRELNENPDCAVICKTDVLVLWEVFY
jgi:hypothetical protein